MKVALDQPQIINISENHSSIIYSFPFNDAKKWSAWHHEKKKNEFCT